MAYTTINDPTDYFNTVVYTGNSGTQSITGVGFQPDFVWGKNRATATHHALQDVVRGNTKVIKSSSSNAEATITNMVTSFDSDGFSLGSDSDMNEGSGKSMVAWNWKANGSASTNSQGATNSSVSVNTTSGISIASVAGNSTTFGHGLGVAPNVIIYKPTSGAGSWGFACDTLGMTSGYLGLNSTAAFVSGSGFIDGTSSTLVTLGSNLSSGTSIYYMFAEKKGYSKFSSYTGNGSSDGTFVYTGFKPALIIQKNSGATGNWILYDNKRDVDNVANKILIPNNTSAEAEACDVDLLSNGFKFRAVNDASSNKSANTYIYMAFAEHPFTSSTGTPVTAR